MVPRANILLHLLALVVLLVAGRRWRAAADEPASYKIANPFTGEGRKEYYLIRSTQTTYSSHRRNEKLEVEDYFSLADGLTYSIHRVQGSAKSWVLIGDGKFARWYVVRNWAASEGAEAECELDRVHSHRQVFPWQYVYDLQATGGGEAPQASGADQPAEPSNKQRKGKKRRRAKGPRKSFVYGTGAIWLNAIKGDVRSSLVGGRSPYQLSNSWVLESERLRLELLFDKPPGQSDETDTTQVQRRLDAQTLASVKIDRKHLVEGAGSGSTVTVDQHSEYIVVNEFKSGLSKANSGGVLEELELQLDICRRTNKGARLFPSLVRALSSSPQHLYYILYTVKYFPAFREPGGRAHDGTYDEKHHRHLRPLELVYEFFHMTKRVEMVSYNKMREEDPGNSFEAFMTRFADKPAGQRTTRHSNAYYHIFKASTNFTCVEGVRESLSEHALLQRRFHFHESGLEHLGFIRGLGALLMNAAERQHKSAGLATRTIKIGEKRKVEVWTWHLYDKHSGWRVTFYFEVRDRALKQVSWDLTEQARDDLQRLVRVDVRDTRAVDVAEDVIKVGQEDEQDDYDLLIQYNLHRINFEMSRKSEAYSTTVPDECLARVRVQPDDSDEHQREAEEEERREEQKMADESGDESDSDFERQYHDQDSDSSDDSSDDSSSDSTAGQKDGEEFEFAPGELHEDFPLPDLFSFLGLLNENSTYQFETRLELLEADERPDATEEANGRKHIWLSEVADLANEQASVSVFDSDEALRAGEPAETYFMLYKSDLMFKLTGDRCELAEDLDNKWLRLLSSSWVYYTVPKITGQPQDGDLADSSRVVESSRLSLLGVGALWRRASESGASEFLGQRRAIIEREGKQYKQLVWLVHEFNMAFRFTFLHELLEGHEQRKLRHLVRHTPEEVLRLDSITVSNEPADGLTGGQFKQVRARLQSFSAGPDVRKELVLPKNCHDAFMEAERMREVESQQVRPPSLLDLLGGPHIPGYYLECTLTRAQDSDRSAGMLIVERFQRARNRAKISMTFKGTPVEIYIEGRAKQIYAHSPGLGKCSPIDSLAIAFKKLMGNLIPENRDFDAAKLYGLAGLLNELSQRDAHLWSESYLDRRGNRHQSLRYKLEVEASDQATGAETPLEVQLTYRQEQPDDTAPEFHQRAKAKVRAQEKLTLLTIRLRPSEVAPAWDAKSARESAAPRSTTIFVGQQRVEENDDWQVPAICLQEGDAEQAGASSTVAPSDASPATQDPKRETDERPVANAQFPRADALGARLNSWHMRSEISLRGELNRVYVLDEWAHNGHLRMRSRGLAKTRAHDFDFILYMDTREQFDLSTPWQCRANSFPLDVLDTSPKTNLLELLLDEGAQVDRLASLYYGPLALWRLAERHLDTAKLIKSIEIPIDEMRSTDAFLEHLAREMDKQIWRISAPASSAHQWAYSLEFHEFSRPAAASEPGAGEGRAAWHALDSIQVEDLEGTEIRIEVVDYNYKPQAEQMLELFRLPEGWGCQRDPKFFNSYHDFKLDLNWNWHLSYEASLLLIDTARPVQDLGGGAGRVSLPTLSGSHTRSYPAPTDTNGAQATPSTHTERRFANADMSVHVGRTRYLNGTTKFRRLVTDLRRPIAFELDEASGECSVARATSGAWQLAFPEDEADEQRPRDREHTTHRVYLLGDGSNITESLFQRLALNTTSQERLNFSPLNKIKGDNGLVVIASYEREYDHLELTRELAGPARVVRRFDRVLGRGSTAGLPVTRVTLDGHDRLVMPYDSVAVRVFLLDAIKTRVRAILDLTVWQHQVPRLAEFLASASVSECFKGGVDPAWDRRVAEYTLEYPMRDYAMRLMARYYLSRIVDEMYANLLRSARVSPLQLDGTARADLSGRDDLLRVHFSLTEAPTSYLYFREHPQSTMSARVEAAAEVRLVPSLLECSLWCDQINCLAMVYCEDHTCGVATSRALFGSGDRKPKEPVRLDVSQRHNSCSYFYSERRQRTRTLRSFEDFMERTVNALGQSQEVLGSFGVSFGIYVKVTPSRFYKSSGAASRWRHEDQGEGLEPGPQGAQVASGPGHSKYARLCASCMLDTLNPGEGLKVDWSHSQSRAECLNICDQTNCLVASHCRNSLECRTITAQDPRTLAYNFTEFKRTHFLAATEGCSISIPGHLDDYQRFEGTLAPANFSRKLEGYSALECAAACRASGEEACLSFDLCVFSDYSPAGQPADTLDEQLHEGAGGREEGLCLLQQNHVTLDSFDRAVLLPAWDAEVAGENRNKIANRPVVCEHYSRSLLASFRRLANKRRLVCTSASIKGISAERCAADCLRDDQCHAFEHCQNYRSSPAQSCYLIRSEELAAAANETAGVSLETLGKLLRSSNVCSVYVAKALAQRERLEGTFAYEGELAPAGEAGVGASSWLPLVLLSLASILLGGALQFAHIQLTGRALLVR